MKRIFCLLLSLCLLIALAGCSRPNNNPPQTSDDASSNTQDSSDYTDIDFDKTMVAVSVPAVTETTKAADGTELFQYTYQHMSLVLHKPDIADKVILDFLNRVDGTKQTAKDTADMAKAAYNGSVNWVPYLYHIAYSPMRVDHHVLSLFGTNVVYSGAGHPERTCVSASYDLQTGDVLTLASIMSTTATADSFRKLVMDGLSEMARNHYLYDNYAETVGKRFSSDTSRDEAWYFSQSGLCFYFAPYEIAPYSSGIISVEIPYEKLGDLLHSAYLPPVRGEATGTVTVTPFEQITLTDFSHIAEIVTSNDGKMYMAHTDGSVQDVRIILTDETSSYTVFAAYELAVGDGIMVQAPQALLEKMKLTYRSGAETVNTKLIG